MDTIAVAVAACVANGMYHELQLRAEGNAGATACLTALVDIRTAGLAWVADAEQAPALRAAILDAGGQELEIEE